ncbi:DNA alkylation repair protein [Enterococcus sp. AZ072]|uniref:DNA alkylation repair protein n=1 Tax=unclassified Enterococcus TaxID=2608891 RepID=UPI003D2AB37C
MTIDRILQYLQDEASDKYKQNIIKLGIPARDAIGVPTSELRKFARKLPKEKGFLFELWRTGYHECKILTVLSLKPRECTKKDITALIDDVYSWDLCDLICKTILIRINFEEYIRDWINSEELYKKRAAFTLIASTSTHAKLSLDEIDDYLNLIKVYTDDERLLVKKAASWALRELGKISLESRELCIQSAMELQQETSKSKQWIATDALKELTTLVQVEGRARLISNKSKMGKQTL